MDIYSEGGLIFLVMVDHLNGELLGGVTVEVIEDGKRAYMEHFTDRVIPDVCFGKRDNVAWAVPVAAPAVSDLALSGCCILNIVVPASVAALMEYSSIADASEEAERAAYITGVSPAERPPL